MRNGKFQVTVRINGQCISREEVDDPFIITEIRLVGSWRERLRFLFGRPLPILVEVGANSGTISAIMRQVTQGEFQRADEWDAAERAYYRERGGLRLESSDDGKLN